MHALVIDVGSLTTCFFGRVVLDLRLASRMKWCTLAGGRDGPLSCSRSSPVQTGDPLTSAVLIRGR